MKNTITQFDWAVVGAGPAGIAAVGKLLDNHVKPEKILWLDPTFTVGDFGTKWRKVPSNTKVNLFTQFLHACESFHYADCQENFLLNTLNAEHTCKLHVMADPLQWVTEQLKKQVHFQMTHVQKLKLAQRHWNITTHDKTMLAKNVILAIGAEPKALPFSHGEIIPLDIALDPDQLTKQCQPNDTIGVIGSSHSAILVIRNLLENCQLKKIINFYQSSLKYAVYLENEILFDDTGLKGTTAEWARENIDGHLPEKLLRVIASDKRKLSECNKVIQAVGFNKRTLCVEGLSDLHYNDRSGIIAPGLFGFGIAFPEAKTDRFGTIEYRVGLWKFMDYLTRILPVWLKYPT